MNDAFPVSYERVKAGEIRVGDSVARARTHEFRTVEQIDRGSVSVRLHYVSGGNDRPRATANWWRIRRDESGAWS